MPAGTNGKPAHIGIVGCSAEGAALCYRTICTEGPLTLGPHAHPEVTMHPPPLSDYVDCLERGDLDGVAELMLRSAEKLAGAGADFLICPDNTIHQAFARVVPRSPLPWLHIAEEVARHAAEKGYTRLGLTGTRWLIESDVYPEKLTDAGIECVRPPADAVDGIDRRIMNELVNGVFTNDTAAYFRDVIDGLKDRGCDAVILGCTEIPLIVDAANAPLPTLDSTRILARASLKRATDTDK